MSARSTLAVSLFALAMLGPVGASAYCPSYTPAGTAGGQNCGIEPALGTNPTVLQWNTIFTTVSQGPAMWGANGPTVKAIKRGCSLPTVASEVAPVFPCHVLKAIAMAESGWQQFCKPDSPSSSVGKPERTIVSFDCGYGIGQVTSGMHVGEAPDFDRTRVASDAAYNLATGTRILRDKWGYTSCVGDRLPEVVEHWYTSVWAYNGLAYSNNPNNPNLTANRKPYNPKNGGSYTYQERVFGRMEYPTSSEHWTAMAVAYPERSKMSTTTGNPGAIPEPTCEGPTSCVNKRSTHTSQCGSQVGDAGKDADAADAFADGSTGGQEAGDSDGGKTPKAVVSDPIGTSPAQAAGGCSYSPRVPEGRWGVLTLLAFAALRRRLRAA